MDVITLGKIISTKRLINRDNPFAASLLLIKLPVTQYNKATKTNILLLSMIIKKKENL